MENGDAGKANVDINRVSNQRTNKSGNDKKFVWYLQ